MKKMGLICMALVIALGIGGIGYASWIDTISITGDVNTGDVDLVVKKYSGTYVWKTDITKDPSTIPDEIEVVSGWLPMTPMPPSYAIDADPNDGEADIDPVGCATAAQGTTIDDIVVDFVNMFPCIDFTADFLLHYAGSIPVKVSVSDIGVTGITGATATIKYYESDAAGTQGTEITTPVGMQLHKCDYILVVITVHIDQDTGEMNGTGTVSGTITVKQWNE